MAADVTQARKRGRADTRRQELHRDHPVQRAETAARIRFTVVAASLVAGPSASTTTVSVIRCRGLREGTDRRYSSNAIECRGANSAQVRPSRSKNRHR